MIITNIFPPYIGFSCVTMAEIKPLLSSEESLLSPYATEKRKNDFLLGRTAAHQALEQLHYFQTPILQGANNEPIWPKNIIGSITHSNKIGVAVATSTKYGRGIGIDLEQLHTKNKWNLVHHICLDSEKKYAQQTKNPSQTLLLLFSAKESIYKAFFPLCQSILRFHDCELQPYSENSFLAHWHNPIPQQYISHPFPVHFQLYENYIFTYCMI